MVRERVLGKLLSHLRSMSDESIGVELPDGTRIPEDYVDHRIVFKTPEALNRTLRDPEMGFGESYMRGHIDVEGDLEKVLVAGNKFINQFEGKGNFSVLFFKVANTVSSVNKRREKKNVQRHYDLGNEFYKLWLDASMTYSCAFFSYPTISLEEAQKEKRKVIYDKLRLEEGDALLDIGCGWGSIILEAAELYKVKAVGITLSETQYEHIKKEIEERGLADRVEVYLMHYADLRELGMKFDKIVSVGMFEHVGREHYKAFFKVVNEMLKKKGLFLLHTIGKVHPASQSRWIRKYIFPGGYLPSIPEVLCAFEGMNFCLIDIDDWRMHYYWTLKEWRKRFWSNINRIWRSYGEEFVRMWDLYLASAAASFYTGSNHLFQFLLSKGVKNDYPVIRRKFVEALALLG